MGTAGAKALRQGCAGRFQEQEEAGVLGAAPDVKCGSGRWGVGKEGYPIMSLSATVRPSTITGVWGGEALHPS